MREPGRSEVIVVPGSDLGFLGLGERASRAAASSGPIAGLSRNGARAGGTDSAKATIMGRLRNAQPGTPGYPHLPADREQAYFEQLLGEVLLTTYSKGQPIREWRPKKGVRHEALDTRVYAYAALRALVSMGLLLEAEADRAAARGGPVRQEDSTVPRVSRSRWMNG